MKKNVIEQIIWECDFGLLDAKLRAADKPLHVSDIISAIEKEFSITLDRDSLSSAIIKQVRKEKRFVRVAPNTFGLRQK